MKRFDIVYEKKTDDILSGTVGMVENGEFKQVLKFELTVGGYSFKSGIDVTHKDALSKFKSNSWYVRITDYLKDVANFHFKKDLIWIDVK